jgi:citrate lyase beta subunit
VAKIEDWVKRSCGLHTILPILESREALDPLGRRDLAQACAQHIHNIPGARIGANDLLALLGGLRRPPNRTIYQTPVGRVIDELIEAFSAYTVQLCGPVFDRVKDLETLSLEVSEDISRGLFAKTAVTPTQVKCIWDCYKPDKLELDEARSILKTESPAVTAPFGSMLERSCHSAWAERLIERRELYLLAPTIQFSEKSSFREFASI